MAADRGGGAHAEGSHRPRPSPCPPQAKPRHLTSSFPSLAGAGAPVLHDEGLRVVPNSPHDQRKPALNVPTRSSDAHQHTQPTQLYDRLCLPLGNGLIGPRATRVASNSSAISTSIAMDRRSSTAMVGFSIPRSRRLTYVRSTPASTAKFSCDSDRRTLNRRKFLATTTCARIGQSKQYEDVKPRTIDPQFIKDSHSKMFVWHPDMRPFRNRGGTK